MAAGLSRPGACGAEPVKGPCSCGGARLVEAGRRGTATRGVLALPRPAEGIGVEGRAFVRWCRGQPPPRRGVVPWIARLTHIGPDVRPVDDTCRIPSIRRAPRLSLSQPGTARGRSGRLSSQGDQHQEESNQ